MKRILILGSTSHIGYSLITKLIEDHYIAVADQGRVYNIYPLKVKTYSFKQLSINHIINNFSPDIIINCIGLVPADANEKNKKLARYLNEEILINIVNNIRKKSIKLIQYSTAYVFKGSNEIITESSTPNPWCYYGNCKLKSERFTIENLDDYLILRLTSVIKKKEPFQRPLLADVILKNLKDNKTMNLINDTFTNYVSIRDVNSITSYLIEENKKGLFHIGGDENYSPYELGMLISKILGKGDIKSVSSSQFYKNNILI